MTHIKTILPLLMATLLIASCHSAKEIPYISDAQRDSAQQILTTYHSTILPGDQLYIYVESSNPESTIPFNQETNTIVDNALIGTIGRSNSEATSPTSQSDIQFDPTTLKKFSGSVAGYLVADDGTILFPVLGRLAVAGLTQDSLCHLLQQRLIGGGYVDDPVVTTRLKNFRVTVVGEVTHPSQFHVLGERLTIFEALALAKDITMDGQRNNIKVLRSENGEQQIGEVDLTSKQVFDSPYYYLQQNDIVYVEPNDLKKKTAYRNTNIPQYISIGLSLFSIIFSTTRTIINLQKIN